jgi:hypothetical protein
MVPSSSIVPVTSIENTKAIHAHVSVLLGVSRVRVFLHSKHFRIGSNGSLRLTSMMFVKDQSTCRVFPYFCCAGSNLDCGQVYSGHPPFHLRRAEEHTLGFPQSMHLPRDVRVVRRRSRKLSSHRFGITAVLFDAIWLWNLATKLHQYTTLE